MMLTERKKSFIPTNLKQNDFVAVEWLDFLGQKKLFFAFFQKYTKANKNVRGIFVKWDDSLIYFNKNRIRRIVTKSYFNLLDFCNIEFPTKDRYD